MLPVVGGRSVQVARLLAPRSVVLVEAVRGRKSRSDPVAKSKVDRIKVPPPVDPVEMVVLKERYTEYKLIMRALRGQQFKGDGQDGREYICQTENSYSLEFKEEVLRRKFEEETGSLAAERAQQEEEEHRALMEWNNQENLRTLKLRMTRVKEEEEEAEQKKLAAIMKREQEHQEFIKEKEKEILQLQEEAKNFITLENLDQRIEEALDNPKNYNFAIDKEGRVVKQTVLH